VAGQVADFLGKRLKNYSPETQLIAARKRGTDFSPDNPEILEPLLTSNVIYMGAGSPTYAIKQLEESLAWHILLARHRLGAHIVWASASPLAISAFTIPVYEIYKVGEDPHWKCGLDFFGSFGLRLIFVPHWNNTDGGANLDTSRCYMGLPRFTQLLEMVPEQVIVVGIEEHTALVIDMEEEICQVMGKGGVILLNGGNEAHYETGSAFELGELGSFSLPVRSNDIPEDVMKLVVEKQLELGSPQNPEPPQHLLDLVEAREAARRDKQWDEADRLRDEILELGWIIQDTGKGPELLPLKE
jgi:hypothetical protein